MLLPLLLFAAVISPERHQIQAPCEHGRARFDWTAPVKPDRWLRLLGAAGTVKVNGATSNLTQSGAALTPYLQAKGVNSIECGCQPGIPLVVESTPRVFIARVDLKDGKASILVTNTLENATNVQVAIGRRSATGYVPPESQIELEIETDGAPEFYVVLTKFAEALEEGYEYRIRVGRKAE